MPEFPSLTTMKYEDIRTSLISGDVILCSGNYTFSKLIQKATGSCWSHVAFILKLDVVDRVMVLESIEHHGVRTVPLSEYVTNFEGTGKGYGGRMAVLRHSAVDSGIIPPEDFKVMAQFAVDRFGYPYDEEEIARITTRIVGSHLGMSKAELVRNNEFICSEYVYECYKRLGLDIAYDKRGFVAPADFAKDPNMRMMWEIEVKQ